MKKTVTLSPEAERWRKRIAKEYGISDSGGELLVQTVCESFDRMRNAQRAIESDGLVLVDRFGQRRLHPAANAERDARSAMLQSLKQLGLDIEILRDGPGRPPLDGGD